MSIYLVDYENVNADGFNGIEALSKNDCVYVFYTTNAENLSFNVHKKLIESEAEIKYFSVTAGKNALDFQLTMFAGYLIGKGTTQNIYIISNDKGFDADTSFYDSYLMSDGVDVVRSTSIAATTVTKEKPSKVKIVKSDGSKNQNSIYNILCDLLPEYSSCDVINISALLLGSQSKREFYTKLVTLFKQENGNKIYTAVKSKFNELRKLNLKHQKLGMIMKNILPEDMDSVNAALDKSIDKNSFHKELVAIFGQKKGSEIYNMLKNHYSNLKNTA